MSSPSVDQQVEGVEGEVRASLVLERRLEQLEARACPSRRARPPRRRSGSRPAAWPRLGRAPRNLSLQSLPLRVQAVAAPLAGRDQQPVAVIFIFVEPVVARSAPHRPASRAAARWNGGGAVARPCAWRGRPSARRGSIARRRLPAAISAMVRPVVTLVTHSSTSASPSLGLGEVVGDLLQHPRLAPSRPAAASGGTSPIRPSSARLRG